MRNRRLHTKDYLRFLLVLIPLIFLGSPADAQSASSQNNSSAQDSDITRGELARFDQFLDSHREIGEQLHKNPSLVNNREFVENHPALQTYLQEHPGIREEIQENPNAFMRQENRFDRQEDRREDDRGSDITRGELARFDQFLDSHREIGERLHKNPSLVNNREFVENHPALQTYLQEHPGIREEIKENPNAFMRQENRFDRQEDRRQEAEARFDRQEDRREDDRRDETTNGHLSSFREFLGSHSDIARQVSKNPSLVKNDDYVKTHPELQGYLNAHPGVRGELMENPQKFVKSAQQFSNATGNAGTTKPAAPAVDLKPKQ
jgi:hypothetical protein